MNIKEETDPNGDMFEIRTNLNINLLNLSP